MWDMWYLRAVPGLLIIVPVAVVINHIRTQQVVDVNNIHRRVPSSEFGGI